MEYSAGSNVTEDPCTVPWDTYLTFPENDIFESQSEADGHICNVQMPSERKEESERPREGNAFAYEGAPYQSGTPGLSTLAEIYYSGTVLPLPSPNLIRVNATEILRVHNFAIIGQDSSEAQRHEPFFAGYIPPTPNLSASSTPSMTSPVCATPDLAADAKISTPITISLASQVRMAPARKNAVASSSAVSLELPITKKRKAEESEPTQARKATKIDNGKSMKYTCDLPQCNGYQTDRLGDWKRHEQSAQHGGTGIKCDKCGKHYARIDSLKRHQQKKH